MNESIPVKIWLFASARDYLREKELQLQVPSAMTLSGFKEWFVDRYHLPKQVFMNMVYSVNQEYVSPETILKAGDEVGIFPPVSGGSQEPPTILQVTDQAICVDELSRQIISPHTGAVVVFSGYVRGETPGSAHETTSRLEYEAYEAMAIQEMGQICREIRQKWEHVYGIFMVQGVGSFLPMEMTTAIGISCGHRDEGVFEAARYGIDRLKEIVPVWKKEIGTNGETWVEGSFHPDAGR